MSTGFASPAIVLAFGLIQDPLSRSDIEQSNNAPPAQQAEELLSESNARAWRVCQQLPGYSRLRESFDVIAAQLGSTDDFPPSLQIELRRTGSGLLNAVWWWDPLDDAGDPRFNWSEFLQTFNDASKTLAR